MQLPNATNYPMPQGPKPGQGGAPHTPKQSKVKHKHSKSNSDATRVTCYPRARVPHVTLGRACHMLLRAKQSKGKQSRGKQSNGKHKHSKSNCDATRVTCYPRAGGPHVTLGRACHMLPWESKAKQSEGKQSNATPRRGKRCHMLPQGGSDDDDSNDDDDDANTNLFLFLDNTNVRSQNAQRLCCVGLAHISFRAELFLMLAQVHRLCNAVQINAGITIPAYLAPPR